MITMNALLSMLSWTSSLVDFPKLLDHKQLDWSKSNFLFPKREMIEKSEKGSQFSGKGRFEDPDEMSRVKLPLISAVSNDIVGDDHWQILNSYQKVSIISS